MMFTPGERRLIALLIAFLGSAYLISGLRACHRLPDPSAGRAGRADAVAEPCVESWVRPYDDSARVSPDDAPGDRLDAASDVSSGAPGDGPWHTEAKAAFVDGYLDLNAADSLALVALPGIGPALAGRILAARAQRGRFGRLEELLEVRGIGAKRLEQLKGYVVVGASPSR
jgi:competence protein ComEA